MIQTDADIKIQMIRNSIRCFACAMLGLIPVLGVGFAVAALVFAGKARVAERRFWNAAKPYRVFGTGLVTFTTLLWIVVAFLIALHMVNSASPNNYGSYYGGD